MDKPYKSFLVAIISAALVFAVFLFIKTGFAVDAASSVNSKNFHKQGMQNRGMSFNVIYQNEQTQYPIDNTTYPITTATYRPTSTRWPSKTPTATPAFFYRATNTIAGVEPPTPTPLPEKTRNVLFTLTAFYTTQTARFSTAEPTEAPTETPRPTFTKTATPSASDSSLGLGDETATSEIIATPTPIHLSVKTDKTDRYQAESQENSYLFYGLLLIIAGLGVFLYMRKNNLLPPRK